MLTQILGTCLDYTGQPGDAAAIERALTDLSGHGFSLSWDASPAPWTRGLLENQEQLKYCRQMATRLAEHGMGSVFAFPWSCLLPIKPDADQLAGSETLDPPRSDGGSQSPQGNRIGGCEVAFAARSRALFEAAPLTCTCAMSRSWPRRAATAPVNKDSTTDQPDLQQRSAGTVEAQGLPPLPGRGGLSGSGDGQVPGDHCSRPLAGQHGPARRASQRRQLRPSQADNDWPDSTLAVLV